MTYLKYTTVIIIINIIIKLCFERLRNSRVIIHKSSFFLKHLEQALVLQLVLLL